MSFEELRTQIRRTLKNAASFYKVDLHVHSKDSYDFAKKDKPPSQKDLDCQPIDFVEHALKKGIQMISITDHNRCSYAFQIKNAAEEYQKTGQDKYEYNSLKVLPGCEISLDYNGRTLHILAVFPEETSEHEIENIFDETGIDPNPSSRTKDSKVTLIKLKALLEKIKRKNGICIACHINETNGLRQEIRKLNEGQILKLEKKQRELKEQGKTAEAESLEHEISIAKQKFETQFEEEIFTSLFDAVEIKKPEERRHFENVQIKNKKHTKACVINSDAHYLSDIGIKTNTTRIKMDEPGYHGLKRAFQDPKTRIKFEEELPQTDIKKILGIRIDKGFLDGQLIGFTENLNCLIGGRGTGKTSLIEIIRFLMEETIPTVRKEDIDSLMRKIFEGSVATMLFQDENKREYVLQRSLLGQEKTSCYDLFGTPLEDISIKDSQIINVDIYGWSEIETIARDPKEQLDLIDKFIEGIEDLKTKEKHTISSLKTNAQTILDKIRQKHLHLPDVSTLPEKKLELEKLKTAELDEAEIKAQQITNESSLLSSIQADILGMKTKIENLNLKTELKTFFTSFKQDIESKDLLYKEWFNNLYSKLEPFKEKIITHHDNLTGQFDQMLNVIKDLIPALTAEHEQISKQFQKLVESVDQVDTRTAIQRRQALYKDVQQMELKKKEIDKLEEEVQNLLKIRYEELIPSLEQNRKQIFKLRDGQISNLQDQLKRIPTDIEISVKIIECGNKESFKRSLEESYLRNIPLRYKDRKIADTISSRFTPVEFVKKIYEKDETSLTFESKEQKKFSIEKDDAQIIINHFLPTDENRFERNRILFELETLDNPDLPQIFLKDGEKPRLIQELSPGQRCTALLPIILLESKNPLIIDQPEDNLDNRLVFDLIVSTIRDLKEKRQIIVATHNPNIPVSGDAEQILVFDSDGDHGYIDVKGCIDNEQVIKKVKEIMEGGEKAFLTRVQKYGITPAELAQPLM